jgi:hypothetical protein
MKTYGESQIMNNINSIQYIEKIHKTNTRTWTVLKNWIKNKNKLLYLTMAIHRFKCSDELNKEIM